MEIGQIFLRLGIKADNLGTVKVFEDGVKSSTKAASAMAGAATKSHLSLGKLHDKFKGLVGPMNAARIELVGFVGTLTYLAERASKAAAGLTQFQNLTGLSTQRLQAWQQQAAMSNVSGEEMAGTIQKIQQIGQEFQLRGGNIGPWALLGIDPRQDPFVVLSQLQKKLSEMSPARGTLLAHDLGLSDSVISFLKEMKSLPAGDRSLILSDAEIKRLKAFNIEFNRVWDGSKRALQKLGEVMLPVAKYTVWLVERLSMALNTATKGGNALIDVFKAAGPALMLIGGVIAAAFFPATTAIVGMLLLFEDIMTWSRGGDSLMKRLFGPFEKWKDTLKEIKEYIEFIKEGIKNLVDGSLESLANWSVGATDPATGKQKSGGSEFMDWIKKTLKVESVAPEDFERLRAAQVARQDARTAAGNVVNVTNNFSGVKEPKAIADEVGKTVMRVTHAQVPNPGN